MTNGFELTVRDVLQRDLFKHAKVVAGASGLNRQVKWTHILETKDFESLINGGELILTTGVGLQLQPDSAKDKTFERLIEKKAAGICIEKGAYFNEISAEAERLANEHHFPIIVFEEIVKFVDITQDLHTLIINQHHQMLHRLSELSKKFTELSLSHNGLLKILSELHQYFHLNTLFITDEVKSYYYPPETKHLDKIIRTYFKKWSKENIQQKVLYLDGHQFAISPVMGLGQIWGYLCIQVDDFLTDEFFFSVLDRASLAIAQILLRNRTIEERKLKLEDELVRNLIRGKDYELDDLQTFFPFASKNLYHRVFVIRTNLPVFNVGEEDWEEIKLQQSMIIRSQFKQSGFFPAVSVRRHEMVIISSFISTQEINRDTDTFSQVINNILAMKEKNILEGNKLEIGVSSVFKDLAQVYRSYEEAKEVLQLRKANVLETYFYEETGIYRLLLHLQQSGKLKQYIHDYLGPLVKYDQETDSDLLKTLTVYLDCGGSKKEAAKRLFIVRQTLYHRLEKIEQLLGENYMDACNRLAVETAIKAYQLEKVDVSNG